MMPEVIEEYYSQLPHSVRAKISLGTLQGMAESKLSEIGSATFQFIESIIPKIRFLLEIKLAQKIGILCLTEKPDILLMWAHWEYEQEWRMLMPLSSAGEVIDTKPHQHTPVSLSKGLRKNSHFRLSSS